MLIRSITDSPQKVKPNTSKDNEVHNFPQTVPYETFQKAQQALQKANQRIRELEQENQQLKAEKWQERKLRKKKDFKPTEKYAFGELQGQIDNPNAHKDEQGFTRFCYATAAIHTVLSDTTVKRRIDAILKQWPDCSIEIKEATEYTEDGITIPPLYINFNDTNTLIRELMTPKRSA